MSHEDSHNSRNYSCAFLTAHNSLPDPQQLSFLDTAVPFFCEGSDSWVRDRQAYR